MRYLLICLVLLTSLALLSSCDRGKSDSSTNNPTVTKSHIGEIPLQTDIDSKAYEWSFLSTPENKEKRLFNSDKKDAFFSANVAGKYEVRLQTDNDIINYTIETYDLPKFNVSSPQIYNNNSALSYSAIINVEGSYSGELESILLMDIKNDLSYPCLMPTDNSFKCMDISLNTGDNAFILQSVDILGKDVIQNLVITKYTDDLFLTLPLFSTNAVAVNETEEITAQIVLVDTDLELTINLVKELEDGTYDFVAEMKNIGNSKYSTTFSANNSKEKTETYRVVALANNDQEIRSLPVMLDYYVFDIENFENVAVAINNIFANTTEENKQSTKRTFTNNVREKHTLSDNFVLSMANELKALKNVEGVSVNDDYIYVGIKDSAPFVIILEAAYEEEVAGGDEKENSDIVERNEYATSQGLNNSQNSNAFTYLSQRSPVSKAYATTSEKNTIGKRSAIFLTTIAINYVTDLFDILFMNDLDEAYALHNNSTIFQGNVKYLTHTDITVHTFTQLGDYGAIYINAHGYDINDLEGKPYHITQVEKYDMKKFASYKKMYGAGLLGITRFYTQKDLDYSIANPKNPIYYIGVTKEFINNNTKRPNPDNPDEMINGFNNSFIFLSSCYSIGENYDGAGAIMGYRNGLRSGQATSQLQIVSTMLLSGNDVNETYGVARQSKSLIFSDAELSIHYRTNSDNKTITPVLSYY